MSCDLITKLNSGDFHSGKFPYPVSQKDMVSWLKGIGYGNKTEYTDEEKAALFEDMKDIYQRAVSDSQNIPQVAYITAGSPGSGKSCLIDELREKDTLLGRKISYICPDSVCLSQMQRTYQADLARELSTGDEKKDLVQELEVRQKMYNKWRPASNALAHLLLADFTEGKKPFYFGSTSSGNRTADSFKFYTDRGYYIHLLHVIAPDDVRWESVKLRDKKFVQTTAEDIKDKGDLLPQRINDTFLKYASKIDFYYREKADGKAILTATWIRTSKIDEEPRGTLQILDPKMYDTMKKVHNETVRRLISTHKVTQDNGSKLLWENSVEAVSTIL